MSSYGTKEKSAYSWPKLIVSLGALLFVVIHMIWPKLLIDAISLGLLIVAALPLLSEFLASATFPGGWGITLIAQRQQQQEYDIQALKFLVSHFLTQFEFEHLEKIVHDGQFIVEQSDTTDIFLSQLRHLLELGFIARDYNKHFKDFIDHLRSHGKVDVKDYFVISDVGREYVKLRLGFASKSLVQDDNR